MAGSLLGGGFPALPTASFVRNPNCPEWCSTRVYLLPLRTLHDGTWPIAEAFRSILASALSPFGQ